MYFAKNVRYLRRMHAYSQEDVARKMGYKSFTTVQKWESGEAQPPFNKVLKLASLLGVEVNDLYSVDLQSEKYILSQVPGPNRIPVYGTVHAGMPFDAIEDIRGYVDMPLHSSPGKEYFALEIRGDSMLPDYRDGDIVIFEKSSDCHDGDKCVVCFSYGEATFKKIRKHDGFIILQPLNSDYEPIQINTNDPDSDITVLGIAREIRRKV